MVAQPAHGYGKVRMASALGMNIGGLYAYGWLVPPELQTARPLSVKAKLTAFASAAPEIHQPDQLRYRSDFVARSARDGSEPR